MIVSVGMNVGDGVNVSVEGMEITVPVKGTLVNVRVATAGCDAEALGVCPFVETLHEISIKRNNEIKKYRLLFFILLLYYRLVFQFLNVCKVSRITS